MVRRSVFLDPLLIIPPGSSDWVSSRVLDHDETLVFMLSNEIALASNLDASCGQCLWTMADKW